MRFVHRCCEWWCVATIVLLPRIAPAQTSAYHVHQEASSTSGLDQLRSTGPDTATASLLSAITIRENM